MPALFRIERPAPGEYKEYYGRYIDRVPGDDAIEALATQVEVTDRLLRGLSEAQAMHRYAPGKWSVKELMVHVADGERVFAYRALRFARNDRTPLPGFEESEWAPESHADRRPMGEILDEFRAVRAASLALFRSFEPEATTRFGTAVDAPTSVRALAWVIAGHELHHVNVLRERYGLGRRA